MAELHWFPFFAKDWLSSPSVIAMRAEQRGAYIHLLALAWGNGETEPSLMADDRTLAALSGLGPRWRTLGAAIRDQFAERNGKLYNEKLSEVWHDQQTKHEQAVKRGRNGGRKKADKRKTVSSPTTDIRYQSEPEPEEAVQIPTEFVPASAPVGALGAEPPRAPSHRWSSDITPPGAVVLEVFHEQIRALRERVS